MKQNFKQDSSYLRAKKRVKEIKGFYTHFLVYVLVNIFISCLIIFGLMKSGNDLSNILTNFGIYSTWLFWGIGIFFHWLGVFGFTSLGFGKEWEEKKIKEMIEKENEKNRF